MRGNRAALVTGGSRGIGAATAILLAERGHDVVISYRENAGAAAHVVAECERAGGTAVAVRADAARPADVDALFREAAAAVGPLTGVVNNAGTVGVQSDLADMDVERIADVVAVNLVGALLCARAAVRHFRETDTAGSIVNVSSAAARLGSPHEYVDYAAAKGGVDTMTLGLAAEVGPTGIRVNAVRPGLIETDIHAAGGEPGRVERLATGVPLRRGGTAVEVAETICWLLSDEASYVSGALLDVSGGR